MDFIGEFSYLKLKKWIVTFLFFLMLSMITNLYCDEHRVYYIDLTGKTVLKPNIYNGGSFKDGLARVLIKNGYGFYDGFINKKGDLVIKPSPHHSFSDFCEGLAKIQISHNDLDCEEGFINKKGEIVIEPKYQMVFPFREGLAAVAIGVKTSYGLIIPKFGFIDKTGKLIKNFQFDQVSSFSEGLAAVQLDGKWGYIDKFGKIIIKPQFDLTRGFSDGFAMINIGGKWLRPGHDFVGGKYGFINKYNGLSFLYQF